MGKEQSFRAKASPRAVLVERGYIQLVEFVQRVGVAAYGTDWPFASTAPIPSSLSENRTVGTNDELVWFVRDQILLALQAGVVTAVVPLIISGKPLISGKSLPVQQTEPVDELEDDDPVATPEPEEEDGAPKLRVFKISSAFWSAKFSSEKLDWNASQVSVGATHLFEDTEVAKLSLRASARSSRRSRASATGKRSIPFLERYEKPPSDFDATVSVLRPELALKSMFRYEELPDDAWFSRFKIYRKDLMPELIAAAWRYIALQKPENKHGVIKEVVEAMKAYLRLQGVDPDAGQGPSEPVLQAMARRIVGQWEHQSLSTSILVSTNPRKPNSPRKAKI